MEINAASVGLAAALWDPFADLMPWLQQQSGLPSAARATVSAALAVDATAYVYAPRCLRRAVKTMLERASAVGHMMRSIDAAVVHVDGEDAEVPVDIFTAEPASGPLFFARTASGEHMDGLGSKDSWYYHAVLNGLVHPLTREPITGFGEYTVVIEGAVNGPDGGADDGAEAFMDLSGPDVFELDAAERAALQAALDADAGPGPIGPIGHTDALRFECFYKVPTDRSYTVQVLGLPPGTYEYFSAMQAGALDDLLQQMADDGDDPFDDDDVAELDDDDDDSLVDDVMDNIMAAAAAHGIDLNVVVLPAAPAMV